MEQILKYIVENWALIVAALSIVVCAVIAVLNFFQKPTEEQILTVREWLLYAVTVAERELGSGTGKLKLRYVYDMFASKFPYLVKFISFDKFSDMVDSALEEMKTILSQNKKIQEYVGVEPTPIEETPAEA